jgi:DNA repair exonuclease SbcCD ATPase subunit
MFFVHLVLFIVSLVLFFRFFMLFKHVCDMEQQGRLSGGFSTKKENGEEPEQEPELPAEEDQESDGYDETGSSDEDYEEDETGSSYAFTGNVTEEKAEAEDETYGEDISSGQAEDYPDEDGQNEKAAVINTASAEYENIKNRVSMTEKNINAAQKGFREMVDRLTDLERRLNNMPVPSPVEKSDFAEAVNSTLEEIQGHLKDIDSIHAKYNASSEDEIVDIREQIKKLSEKITSMPEKADRPEETADTETLEHLLDEINSLKEKNTGLENSLQEIQKKIKENIQSDEKVLKIQEELKALRKDTDSLTAQSVEENSSFTKMKEELSSISKTVNEIPAPVEESEAFRDLRKAIDENRERTSETEKRIAALEEELQDTSASREYTVEYLENIIGDFDKMNKEEIRVKLRQLKQDIAGTYTAEENPEE